MVKINGPDGVLQSPPDKKNDGTQWTPFTDTALIETVRGALGILRNNITNIPTCDQYFVGLPGKRSFTDVLDDPYVWISYDPTGPAAAETLGKHVTLGKSTLTMGRWAVAATLVHELAHVNGASDVNGQAEQSLAHCGLKAHVVTSNTVAPGQATIPIRRRP